MASIQGSIHSSLTPRSSLASMTPRADPLRNDFFSQATPAAATPQPQPATAPAAPPQSPAKPALTKENLRAMSEPAVKKTALSLPLSPVLPDCSGSPEPILVPPHRRPAASRPSHAAQQDRQNVELKQAAQPARPTSLQAADSSSAYADTLSAWPLAMHSSAGLLHSTPLPKQLHHREDCTVDAHAHVAMLKPADHALQRTGSNKENADMRFPRCAGVPCLRAQCAQ